MGKSHRSTITITATGAHCCKWCGQHFDWVNTRPNGGGLPPKHCSKLCADRQVRQGQVEQRDCEWCGAPFEALRHNPTRSCSSVCKAALKPNARLSVPLPAGHPARPKRAPLNYDHLKSPLRLAIEHGRHVEVIEALRLLTVEDEYGCWIWQRRSRDGYPLVNVGSKQRPAHRLMLEAALGRPLGEQAAHHRCANTLCVNPEHLQPVTARDNTAEMLARTYMQARIRSLETELARHDPGNPLLLEVGLAATG